MLFHSFQLHQHLDIYSYQDDKNIFLPFVFYIFLNNSLIFQKSQILVIVSPAKMLLILHYASLMDFPLNSAPLSLFLLFGIAASSIQGNVWCIDLITIIIIISFNDRLAACPAIALLDRWRTNVFSRNLINLNLIMNLILRRREGGRGKDFQPRSWSFSVLPIVRVHSGATLSTSWWLISQYPMVLSLCNIVYSASSPLPHPPWFWQIACGVFSFYFSWFLFRKLGILSDVDSFFLLCISVCTPFLSLPSFILLFSSFVLSSLFFVPIFLFP